MSTNPFDMDDLLGAYALDAVDDDERRAVEEYLATSPRARAEVQEHREVATMLAWSGMDAPEGLWDRIAGSIEGHEETPAASLGKVLSLRPSKRSRMRTVGSWAIATAAAAIIAIAAVQINKEDTKASNLDSVAAAAFADPALLHAQLSSAADGGVRVLAVIDGDGRGYLQADSLPVLSDERTYQLWGAIDGNLISLGLLGTDPKISIFNGDRVTQLAITEEVRGGVTTSQHAPVVSGLLA